ncbi:MAG: A/G-specific adenine glycosylase [archaeon]
MYEKKRKFHKNLREWSKKNLKNYPWRNNPTEYEVLVSEILLQQTNSKKIKQVYPIFIKKYSSIQELSKADENELNRIIEKIGLMYKSKRLINISNKIVDRFDGNIPSIKEKLIGLKGIGQYISNAILCFGYNKRVPIVDTNIIRIYRRIFDVKSNKNRPRTDEKIWKFAEKMLPENNYRDFNYALLDFGNKICKANNPKCNRCPMTDICYYYGSVVGKNESEIN